MKKLLVLIAAAAVLLVGCKKELTFENPDSKKDVIASGIAPADIEAWENEVDADFAAVLDALGSDGDLDALAAFDAKYGTDMAETGARFAAARAARSGSSSSSGSSSYPAMQNMPFNLDGAVYVSGGISAVYVSAEVSAVYVFGEVSAVYVFGEVSSSGICRNRTFPSAPCSKNSVWVNPHSTAVLAAMSNPPFRSSFWWASELIRISPPIPRRLLNRKRLGYSSAFLPRFTAPQLISKGSPFETRYSMVSSAGDI